ncbi:MAG: Tripeptide aminopeptidase [Anaerolineaceae bacterium 46_22]|nr:MAG: Tripeptide aminopeptidase [Anaerolineaceae bacterium 46_22]
MNPVISRFIRYIKIDTQSARKSDTFPSTQKQLELAKLLEQELKELGLKDAAIDEFGYVTATLPANTDQKDLPIIGFLAHMDTSPDLSGENVDLQFIEDYDGGTVVLNAEKNITMSPDEFPALKKYIGKTLITTDGTTLLGADNKAGIAEIMTAVEYLLAHPEIKHGTIKIGFTPDEEVGHGVDYFDVEKFGADFAYTIDGGEIGEVQYENFNAAGVEVTIHGRNVHPGKAKMKMRNALLIGMEFNELLPVFERPEFTENYEGFYHLYEINGTVEEAAMAYIIRDHDSEKFEVKKRLIQKAADFINEKYGERVIELTLEDQYYNMREMVEPHPEIMKIAVEAVKSVGVTPLIIPVRGGTDGSRLSYMGLPTPNIFTGGHYFHGKYEFIPTFAMEKAVETLVAIAALIPNR